MLTPKQISEYMAEMARKRAKKLSKARRVEIARAAGKASAKARSRK